MNNIVIKLNNLNTEKWTNWCNKNNLELFEVDTNINKFYKAFSQFK
jgi:hypothetical protein